MSGWYETLNKGISGEYAGQYLIIAHFESVERRDQLFPAPNVISEEFRPWQAANPVVQKLLTYINPLPWTDYVEIGR